MGMFDFLRSTLKADESSESLNNSSPSDNSEELERLLSELVPTQDALITIQRQLIAQKRIMQAAMEMHSQGPEANTPLASLLREGVVEGTLLSIMTSPYLNDWDKLQVIMALTITSMREYEVGLY